MRIKAYQKLYHDEFVINFISTDAQRIQVNKGSNSTAFYLFVKRFEFEGSFDILLDFNWCLEKRDKNGKTTLLLSGTWTSWCVDWFYTDTKALVSATQLSGAQSARSLRLSASGAQIFIGERWARAHPKSAERERKLALIFALTNHIKSYRFL